jgi:hypothetical protein
MQHDDTPWVVEAIEPIVIRLRPTLEAFDDHSKAEVVMALSDALMAGYRAGAAGATFVAETIAQERGIDLHLPPLEERSDAEGEQHTDTP